MQISQITNTQTYTLNSEGSIDLKSIKDKSIFNIAKKYDTDNNGLLEYEEINKFLKEYGAIQENRAFSVYYSQQDNKGNANKRSLISKVDNTQLTYFYRDNKPVRCVILMQDGKKHIMNLNTGEASLIKDPNDPKTIQKYKLNDQNLRMFVSIGTIEEEGLLEKVMQFIKKLF